MTRPRHKYSKSDIDAALHLVSQGSSIYRAAKIYKIPRQTLSDKVHGTHPGSIGKPTTFTKEEEMKMSAYGITMAKMGYGVTTRDLCFGGEDRQKRATSKQFQGRQTR